MTTSHTIMPYFHALAVFDVREFSLEGADLAASELFKSLRHPRMLFYEHDTSGGLGPYSPSAAALYFTVIADFDVEAQNEEKAESLAEEVLEGLSTDEIQFLTFGLVPGDRRVVPQVQEEARRAERGGREERGGKGRRSRSRGKKREAQREAEGAHEENFASAPEPELEETVSTGVVESPAAEMHEEVSVGPAPTPASSEGESLAPAPKAEEEEELKLPVPPPRSSSSMRVTLSVTLHASELVPQTNGSTLPDQHELVALALAEARRRYPELPAELTPESEVVSQPWGDTVLTLTWHYDVPVPSASLEEA